MPPHTTTPTAAEGENINVYDCPICKGCGKLPIPRHRPDEQALKEQMARTLVDAGYSYRQVSKMLGWNSANSVMLAVRKGDKVGGDVATPRQKPKRNGSGSFSSDAEILSKD